MTKARNAADFIAGVKKANLRKQQRARRAAKNEPKIGEVPTRAPRPTRKRPAGNPKHDSSGGEGDEDETDPTNDGASTRSRRVTKKQKAQASDNKVSKLYRV